MSAIVLTVRIHQEGEHYVGAVEELGVSSFGETRDEALRMTVDAVCTHLAALDERWARELLDSVVIRPADALDETGAS